jgi:hypothetical protein
MIHLRSIYVLMIVSLAITNIAYAAPSSDDSASATTTTKSKVKTSKKSKVDSKTRAGNTSALAGQTDIVAKVDLPMVTNITPWRDAEENSPNNILEFSVLKDSLTPTDRDRLAGEIRYTSILNKPLDQK